MIEECSGTTTTFDSFGYGSNFLSRTPIEYCNLCCSSFITAQCLLVTDTRLWKLAKDLYNDNINRATIETVAYPLGVFKCSIPSEILEY